MTTPIAPLVALEPLATRLKGVHSQLEATQSDTGLTKDACAGAKKELALILEEMKRTLTQWPEEQLQYLLTHTSCAVTVLAARCSRDIGEDALVALQHILSAHRQLTQPDALIPRLPPELIVKILEQVHADCVKEKKIVVGFGGIFMCLRLCSLVHSSWREIAQSLLFRNIRLSRTSSFALLRGRVQASPQLASKADELDLSHVPPFRAVTFREDIAATLRSLPRLRQLVVVATENGHVSEGLNDLVRLRDNDGEVSSSQESAGNTVKHLTLCLHYIPLLPSPAPLLPEVFPNLRSLTLVDVGSPIWGYYLGRQRCTILHSLNLGTFDVKRKGNNLRNWIHLLPSFVALRCLALKTSCDLPLLPELLPSLPPMLSYLYLVAYFADSTPTFVFKDLEAKHYESIPSSLEAVRVATAKEGPAMSFKQQKSFFGVTDTVETACAARDIEMLVGEKLWAPLELAVEYPSRDL